MKSIKIITAVFFIITVIAIWQTIEIYPDIDIIKREIEAQKDANKDSENTLQRATEFINFASKNQEIINKFSLILPLGEDKANLLSTLESMSSANGLNAMKISFEGEKPVNQQQSAKEVNQQKYDFETKTIAMSLRGSYSSFKNFLVMAENNLRIMDIVLIDFSSGAANNSKEAGGAQEYSYNIKIKTYLYNPPKEGSIAKMLSSGKFKNFAVNDLGFVKEKPFNDLVLSPDYNINIDQSEIGNQNIF